MPASGGAPDGGVGFPIGRVRESGGPLSRWLGRWGVGLGVAIPIAFWVAILAFSAPGGGPPPAPIFAALLGSTWLGPLAALAAWRSGRRTVRGRQLRVTTDRVIVVDVDGREHAWARAEITAGVDLGGQVALELRGGRRVEIDVGQASSARVLDALELGPTDRRAAFRWRRPFAAILGGTGAFALLGAFFLLVPSAPLGALVCPILAGLPWCSPAGSVRSSRSAPSRSAPTRSAPGGRSAPSWRASRISSAFNRSRRPSAAGSIS